MTLNLGNLKRIVYDAVVTNKDEILCPVCFEHLDEFVDLVLAGKNAAQAMPLVQDHLDRCPHCREEFEALLNALRSLQDEPIH